MGPDLGPRKCQKMQLWRPEIARESGKNESKFGAPKKVGRSSGFLTKIGAFEVIFGVLSLDLIFEPMAP